MEREVVRRTVVRYGLLFLVSVLLVGGFWFHGSLYELGLVPLLLVGGLATFFVLLIVRASGSGQLWQRRPAGDVTVRREQAAAIASGEASLTILPLGTRVPLPGSVANARVSGADPPIARVEIRDFHRQLVADVGEDEARAAGYAGAEAFRRTWSEGRPARPDEIVLLLEFRREETT